MKPILFIILSSIFTLGGNTFSQGRGSLEVGEYFDNLTHSFSGERTNFTSTTIYFEFTLYDGFNGKINSNYCKVEVDAVKDNGRELELYTGKFDTDPEWYMTWNTIHLFKGKYRLKLYDHY